MRSAAPQMSGTPSLQLHAAQARLDDESHDSAEGEQGACEHQPAILGSLESLFVLEEPRSLAARHVLRERLATKVVDQAVVGDAPLADLQHAIVHLLLRDSAKLALLDQIDLEGIE